MELRVKGPKADVRHVKKTKVSIIKTSQKAPDSENDDVSSSEESAEENEEESSDNSEGDAKGVESVATMVTKYKWWLSKDDKHYFLQNHAKVFTTPTLTLLAHHRCHSMTPNRIP